MMLLTKISNCVIMFKAVCVNFKHIYEGKKMGRYVIVNGIKTLRTTCDVNCVEQTEQRTRFTDFEHRCKRIADCPYKVRQLDGRGNLYYACGLSYKF